MRSFHTVEVVNVIVEDQDGVPQPGKRVRVQSVFDAPPGVIWGKVTQPALLAHVAYPLLVFRRQDGQPLPEVWHAGDSVGLNLFGLGLIPLGPHVITVERINADDREIRSRESGLMAETWLHRIAVTSYADGRTLYTDEIDIYAGVLMGAVAAFARFFYCYRQTRWRGVIQRLKEAYR